MALKVGGVTVVDDSRNANIVNTFGFKNRLINGNMQIDQKNNGAAVTPVSGGYFTVDRWALGASQASKLTVQQVTDAPPGAKNSLKVTVASQYSPLATDIFCIYQAIEGIHITDLQWGTSGALTISTSFQIKSSITGTFCCAVTNLAGTRSYVANYTISAANTWTPFAITVAGETSGVWPIDTSVGMYVVFDLGYGSNNNTTAGSWQSGNYRNTSTSTKFVNQTAGATWQLAQVQLEVGPFATAFDYRDHIDELIKCQRYLTIHSGISSQKVWTGGYGSLGLVSPIYALPVPQRTTSSVTVTNASNFQYYNGTTNAWTSATPTLYSIETNSLGYATGFALMIVATTDSAVGTNRLVYNPSANSIVILSAEL